MLRFVSESVTNRFSVPFRPPPLCIHINLHPLLPLLSLQAPAGLLLPFRGEVRVLLPAFPRALSRGACHGAAVEQHHAQAQRECVYVENGAARLQEGLVGFLCVVLQRVWMSVCRAADRD